MRIGVFLFTDIEGSTRMWADRPAQMTSVLARHDALLADALALAGGTVFKHTGDGMCAVFSSSCDAMLAAVSAQQRLAAADWGDIGELKVRMAIHAGEAERRDGDWFGPALNRTARLLGVAHGGQVVASSAAVDLAVDTLPSSLQVRDLGVHRLRDLAQTEHVWQLVGEGLDGEFPALRSLDRFRGKLPTLLTSFLGRDEDLQELATALIDHRLVTLVGPGGVGKTRLALQTAAATIDRFVDGTWFIELGRLTDASALDHVVSTTLGLVPRRGLTERRIVLEALRDWRALLIVDNCEHMLAETAALVHDLLRATASVVMLATSREPLHLAGETVWPVEPLPVEAGAVELFVERATAVRRDFTADADNGAIAAICRKLDGIPLALELAAARMRSITAVELLARLDRRFRLLDASAASVVEGRHASLLATMDWSFELLGEHAQAFFAHLSVFPGTFSLDAAHSICGTASSDELASLDLLDALMDKSLVRARRHHGETRYSLLETMRDYGRQRFTAEQYDELRRRHAAHFAAFATRADRCVRSADDVTWVQRVDEELDNLRAAMEFALGRQDADLALCLVAGLEFYNQPRRNSEIWSWAEAAIALPGAETHPLAVTAYRILAFGGHARDNPPEATGWARRARQLHADLGLPPDPRLGIMLCYGTAFEGLVDEAAAACHEAMEIAASIGPEADVDRAEAIYQSICVGLGNGSVPDVVAASELVSFAERLGNTYELMRAKTGLGLAVRASDPVRGAALLDEAVALARSADPPYWTGSTVVFAAASRPDARDALRRLAVSLDEYRATGTQQWIRRTLREFLGAFSSLGRHEMVALIDGCTPPFTLRPEHAQAAVQAAQQHLGMPRYDAIKAHAGEVSDSELGELIRAEIAPLVNEEPLASEPAHGG